MEHLRSRASVCAPTPACSGEPGRPRSQSVTLLNLTSTSSSYHWSPRTSDLCCLSLKARSRAA